VSPEKSNDIVSAPETAPQQEWNIFTGFMSLFYA